MAQRNNCATSRFSGEMKKYPRNVVVVFLVSLCKLLPSTVVAGLYTASDQIILLSPDNVKPVLVNSSTAIVVEFYASWCGHCIAFSPVYKRLARDIKEWKPAVDLAAIDCADEESRKVCTGFGIRAYPTLKFFHAYGQNDSAGQAFKGFPRDVRGLRHHIVDQLENHQEPWPPACPPLEPTSQAEIDIFLETNNVQHLALIFEDVSSYIGREVTLDLLQFENIAVRRVLSTEEGLVTKMGVTEFPSCYLYYPGGNFTRLKVNIEARAFYSFALQRLPGVVRSGKPPPVTTDLINKQTEDPWRPFNRSSVYMADLESTLHYSLRVELAAHPVITGEGLTSLRKYISVLAEYFPGRPMLMNLLKSLNLWLQNQAGNQVSYQAFLEILENSAQAPDTALPEGVRWVGCQGSQPHLRRYPCGVWTLFHLLTVQAKKSDGSDPQEVLSAMRGYIRNFFGCRACAEHFENMAKESLTEVNTYSAAILWLWSRHNRVNNRIAGSLSEDPNFPKIQWPSPDMCKACHTVKDNGEHRWNNEQVLPFLQTYFSAERILTDYLEDESVVLAKQKEKRITLQQILEGQKRAERKARDAITAQTLPPPAHAAVEEEVEEYEEEEEEEEDEVVSDEEEEGMDGGAEMEGKTLEPTPWAPAETKLDPDRLHNSRKPSIVGMKTRDQQEDIVDLDSFVNQHYKAKVMQVATSSRVKQRTLQRNQEEQDSGPVFGLGMELDAGLGMVGLQPLEPDFGPNTRMQKRELTGRLFSSEEVGLGQGGRWVSMLSIGFSKVDISLCVILYFLSSMCLLAMYLFFRTRVRLRRAKVSLP
ncbi:sulfhydryl oxidase 1 [Dunckerocampus dactyliophorus]|uniref:sulfhydryl oxidase 1 n=1 Tax=Dunckerocampus dactyliophorus TaxID=161453 RepID=UPI0024069E47|nr:sulfhydryl oxidase 1 [Dunckerocampus dactyliophorus]